MDESVEVKGKDLSDMEKALLNNFFGSWDLGKVQGRKANDKGITDAYIDFRKKNQSILSNTTIATMRNYRKCNIPLREKQKRHEKKLLKEREELIVSNYNALPFIKSEDVLEDLPENSGNV